MSESALQRWGRRFLKPKESPPVEESDSASQLEAAKGRFVATFLRGCAHYGLPVDDERAQALEIISGKATPQTAK